MLKEEFDKLTGVVSEDEEYCIANAAYMYAGDIDKVTFCSEYMKARGTINALVSTFVNLKKNLDGKELENMNLRSQRLRLGSLLLKEAVVYSEDSPKRKSILEEMNEMFNKSEMILFKLKIGVKLSLPEFEYAREMFTKEQ